MFGILTAKIQIIFGKPPFFHKKLLVIPYSDKVAGLGEGCPRDVEPAGAGEELVGVFTTAEERDETLELLRVAGADVGGAALKVL